MNAPVVDNPIKVMCSNMFAATGAPTSRRSNHDGRSSGSAARRSTKPNAISPTTPSTIVVCTAR
jgi:hypothetical protein